MRNSLYHKKPHFSHSIMRHFLRFHEEFHQAKRCLNQASFVFSTIFIFIFKTSSNVAQVDYEQSCGWNSNSVRAEGILKKSRPAFSSPSSRPTTLDQLAFSKHENRLNFSYNNVIIPITKHDPPFYHDFDNFAVSKVLTNE